MGKTSAERVREYRQRQRQAGKPDSSQRGKAERERWRRFEHSYAPGGQKPFVGCDGEGAGQDDLGRQLYLLFRMGERELFTGSHLSTEELLDFICDEPDGSILVGFSFGYDVTMILRDLPEGQARRLFQPHEQGEGKSRYTWFKSFDIEYLPKQYFRVRRSIVTFKDGKQIRTPVKNSARTIYETFGFFQKSFVKVIEEFQCGTDDQRKSVALDKARRANFETIGNAERSYCHLECQLLAELMEKLRAYCYEANIRPRTWNGAGKLATSLHSSNRTITAAQLKHIPADVISLANMAYYGGRFEITRTGLIGRKVWEYDLLSAYPAAMRDLPCLEHGHWQKFRKKPSQALFVCSLRFTHEAQSFGQICGFPVRSKEGHLYWPLQGAGVYWSREIEAAKKLGANVTIQEGWEYVPQCSCKPFEWVEELFEYRRKIGKSGPGYPIKLGINSLYGKLAQRIGAGKFANMIWAGLITAITRARIMDAAALAPNDIAMIATDGIYSLVPLDLDIGERLGQWEAQELQDLFIVQPGLYWSPDKRKKKSRGLSARFFEEAGRTERFEDDWRQWLDSRGTSDFPSSSVPFRSFIGLKIALARGKIDVAGTWVEDQRTISFDYRNKREGHYFGRGHIVTAPKPGGRDCISLPHKDFLAKGGQEPWEQARAMLEDMPDYVDLSPPFKD